MSNGKIIGIIVVIVVVAIVLYFVFRKKKNTTTTTVGNTTVTTTTPANASEKPNYWDLAGAIAGWGSKTNLPGTGTTTV